MRASAAGTAISAPLRELEAFLDVARLGSFTRAARSLNMSQPALTVRIRHLEEALWVRLLDRTTRSVTLTQVGREFLPVVERVIGEITAVADNARELVGKRRGLVTVAALPSDRKSTRLNSSHTVISYAVFCLKKKKNT